MVTNVDGQWKKEEESGKEMGLRMSTQGLSTLSVRLYLFERRGSEANVV